MAAPTDQAVATRIASPDVFTGLLLVAVILLGLGVAAMYFTNTEHSATDRSPGGPIKLVDSQ
jgi:NO-binding membrane sensor protein with MHYT domain